MFVLLAHFHHFAPPQTAEANSCGTVYLYRANCTYYCTYYPSDNETTCSGKQYDHYTAPSANRKISNFTQTYSGQINPTGCPTMCSH